MAFVNTAGAAGMLFGPMCGGILVALGRDSADPLAAYRNVFYLAGGVCALWVVWQSRWLTARLALERGEHARSAAQST